MELSYAGKKLKGRKTKLKASLVFFDILVAVLITLVFGLYLVLAHIWLDVNIVNRLLTRAIEISLFTIIFFTVLWIAHKIKYRSLNKKFEEFYIKLLEDESMLEGLTLFMSKRPLTQVELDFIKKHHGISKLQTTQIITQSSSSVYFDLVSFNYDTHQKSVIIKTKTDKFFEHFIQIRNTEFAASSTYNDLAIKQYGLSKNSNDNYQFAIYSTLGTEVYDLFKEAVLERLMEFYDFMKAPLSLTVFEDNLLIFVEGWQINLKRTLKDKDSLSIIDAQIEALKRLQTYVEEITLLLGIKA